MKLPPALQSLQARFLALPAIQQRVVVAIPALLLAGMFLYLTYDELALLGPDEKLPVMMRREVNPDNLWSQINTLQSQIDEQQGKINKRPEYQAQLDDLQAQIREIEGILPTEQDKTEIRQVIQSLTKEVPAELGSIQLNSVSISDGGGDNKGNYRTVIYTLELQGELNAIIAYIDLLEKPSAKNQRFMTLSQFDLRPGGITGGGNALVYAPHSVNLTLMTYIYQPKGKK